MDFQRRALLARRISRVAGVGVCVSAALVLGGWAFDIQALRSLFVGGASMKANTALACVLAGLTLAVGHGQASRARFVRFASALVGLIAIITIVEYLFGWNAGFDELLFRDPGTGATTPGRMAPITACCLLGVSLAALLWRDPGRAGIAQTLILLVTGAAALAIIGYAYNLRIILAIASRSTMAPGAALLMIVLGVGMLLAHPEVGWTGLVLSDGLGGATSRRLLPVAVFAPILVGWVVLQGPRAGLYGSEFALALVVVTRILILGAVIMWTARSLQRVDAELQAVNRTLERRVEEKTRELSRSEVKFRALLEAAPDGMVIVDEQDRIVLVNAQTETLFCWPREQLLGQKIEMLVPGGDDALPWPRRMGAGVELIGLRRDGSQFPIEISLSPLQTEDGMLVSSAIRDITERKRLERQMQEASRMKSEFLANMSHELRTPMHAIIGFTDLLHKGRAGALSGEQREYVGDVLTSASHLLHLIDDVLDIAKVEAGAVQIKMAEVDLVELVEEVRTVLGGLAGAKRLTVTVSVHSDRKSAVVDPARVKQMLYNYLSNAIKFTPDGGVIQIRVLPEGPDWFRIDVEDSGVGVAEGDLHKLFVEFQQLDSGAGKKYQGTGLGLALTKRLVEAHGGHVEVRSAIGRGSTFSAVLPRSPHRPTSSRSVYSRPAAQTDRRTTVPLQPSPPS